MHPALQLPAGFRARRPRIEDAGAVAKLMRAAEKVTGGAPETTAEDVRRWWAEVDPAASAWLLSDESARVAAYADIVRRTNEEYAADGYVHPDFTSRGLGRYLVRLTEGAARDKGAARLTNAVLARDTAAVRLLESEHYETVRHFYRMAIDLPPTPIGPEWPQGLSLATPARAHLPAVHAAINEAFAEEWDFVSDTFDAWMKRKESEGFDPALCFTAWAGDEIAGVAQCSHRYGAGWVNALAVRPSWRRRGLGQALLWQAIGEMSRRGEKRVALGVDAANPTGATRLYERAGMHVEFEAVVYRRHL